jgi:DMSO/TMAO reductase YedYZ molybdopterin-dependent catalytic subunit
MKRLLMVTLVAMALVSCASPMPPATEAPSPTVAAVTPSPEATATPQESTRVPEGIQYMHPADVDNSVLPITPVEELHHTGQPQEYDIDTYRLVVDGLVENPLSLTYDEVRDFPQVTETVLLICSGFFWDNAEWTGTPLRLILEEAGLSPEAVQVHIVGGDGYRQLLSLEEATADGVFLAYEVNGETLPTDHGYPLRLVVRHQYGSKWVKWVEHIEVLS